MWFTLWLVAFGGQCLSCRHDVSGFPLRQGLPARVADTMNDAAILGIRAVVDQEEIETARWAATHSTSPRVKAFTQSLLRGHSNAQNTAAALATRLRIERKIPGDSDSAIVRRHRETMSALHQLHGTAFDRAFLKSVRDDHVSEIAKVGAWYGPGAKRDSVKAYLQAIMPTLAKHRDAAEKLLASK
jgi:predicted outer membrane protein